jgi:hypothetical protein
MFNALVVQHLWWQGAATGRAARLWKELNSRAIKK